MAAQRQQQALVDLVKSLASAPAFSGSNVAGNINEFSSKLQMFVTISGVDPANPTTVIAVATRLEGAAAAWWSALNPKPQSFDDFIAALHARFLPANWAMSAALHLVDLRPASSVADVPRLIASFQTALSQLPPQTSSSQSAYILLLAMFVSKLPADMQKDLRTRPPHTLAEAITAIQAAVAVSAPREPAQAARSLSANAHLFAASARRPNSSRARGAGPGPRPGPRPPIDGNPLLPARPGPPRRPNGVTDAEYAVRLAEGLCVGCGADDHLWRNCPIKSSFYSGVHVRPTRVIEYHGAPRRTTNSYSRQKRPPQLEPDTLQSPPPARIVVQPEPITAPVQPAPGHQGCPRRAHPRSQCPPSRGLLTRRSLASQTSSSL